MPPLRRAVLTTLAVLATVVLMPLPAVAAPSVSAEVSGGSAAARAAAGALRNDWAAAVASGGYTAPAPMVMTTTAGSAVTGVVGTTASGTTVSVARLRYSAGTDPVFVATSTNPGTAACTGSGLTLQGSAPRPTSIVGNPGCTNGNGTVYTESGGTGDGTTRDAVTFTFSRPLWAFGAWFGDLETRTDGLGVPALVQVSRLRRRDHRAVPGDPHRRPVRLQQRQFGVRQRRHPVDRLHRGDGQRNGRHRRGRGCRRQRA